MTEAMQIDEMDNNNEKVSSVTLLEGFLGKAKLS